MFFLSLLYLVLTIIRPQDYIPSIANVPIMPVVLGLAFLGWIISPRKSFAEPQYPLLVMFLMAMLMSQVANGWVGGALKQLKDFGPYVAAFFVLSTSLTTRRRMVVTLAVTAMCTILLALHGIQQADTGVGWTGKGLVADGRICYVGIFNDPNDLGLLFVIALPMIMYMAGYSRFLMRLFWLAGAIAVLYGVYLTQSRGTLLAVMLIFGIWVWRKRGAIWAGVLGGIGLAVVMAYSASRVQDIGVDDPSAFGRVDAWYEGMHMFFSDPLFGIGAGNFTDYNYLTAHNSLVLVLAETGLLGYTCWLAFVGYGFLMMWAIMRHTPDAMDEETALDLRAEQKIASTLFLSLCGCYLAAFFLSRSYIVLLYLQAAMVVGQYIRVRHQFPSLPSFDIMQHGWRWIPISLASIVALYLMVMILLHSA